jgi:hypothetical protein
MLTPLLDGTVREALMCAVDGGLTRVSILPAVHGTLPAFLHTVCLDNGTTVDKRTDVRLSQGRTG